MCFNAALAVSQGPTLFHIKYVIYIVLYIFFIYSVWREMTPTTWDQRNIQEEISHFTIKLSFSLY